MKKINAEPHREIDFSNAKRGAVIPLEPEMKHVVTKPRPANGSKAMAA
jgi:hypothetical protein